MKIVQSFTTTCNDEKKNPNKCVNEEQPVVSNNLNI